MSQEPARRRVALLMAYDGCGFHGLQTQAAGIRTVQDVVEQALARLWQREIRIHAAGRTDAGVHALGQVVHADLEGGAPTERLVPALNSLLPDDLVVRRAVPVAADFHARFAAVAKRYVYRIYQHPLPSPFLRRYALHQPQALDREAMAGAAAALVGRRDFASFAAAGRPTGSTVRTLERLDVVAHGGTWGPELRVVAVADGFLYKMVRNLVGTLLEVGLGRLPAARVPAVCEARDRQEAGPTAPACGLWLAQVRYEPPLWDGEDGAGAQNLDVEAPFT